MLGKVRLDLPRACGIRIGQHMREIVSLTLRSPQWPTTQRRNVLSRR
jgi:hypothetical protein